VRFHLFSANEDEYAVTNACRLSPYWGITFPRHWPEYDRYIDVDALPERERRRREHVYMLFIRKLTVFSRRRPVLKNPYNTARLALLHRLFPDAKFVHIRRHPFNVYRSNLHLMREGHVLGQLQDPPEDETSYEARFLDNYRAMEAAYVRDRDATPDAAISEIAFEDLEQDPKAVMRRIYDELGLDFSAAYEKKLDAYLAKISGYRKNTHPAVPERVRSAVLQQLSPLMERWGYRGGAKVG
jgi:hypothetical protein